MRFQEREYDVRVARIGKPHGIRGEVTVEVFTDSPVTRFAKGNELVLRMLGGQSQKFNYLTIEKSRWNKNVMLLKFAEVDDRNTAESLRNSELYASSENSLDDEDGWYANELIGLLVHEDEMTSDAVGKVSNLISGQAQDLLEIQLTGGQQVLLPFVEEIVPVIDTERGAIVITPPPGLLELNQD